MTIHAHRDLLLAVIVAGLDSTFCTLRYLKLVVRAQKLVRSLAVRVNTKVMTLAVLVTGQGSLWETVFSRSMLRSCN